MKESVFATMRSKMVLNSFISMLLITSSSITYISKAENNSTTHSSKVSAIYLFGDSLFDVGNNNNFSGFLSRANFPHNGIDFPNGKPTGRFSNGQNAADFIAEKMGLPTPPSYLSITKLSNSNRTDAMMGGVNFASGGAGVLDETFKQLCIPLGKQVENMGMVLKEMGSDARQHLWNSIFFISVGHNDLYFYYQSNNKTTTPLQIVNSMLSTLHLLLKRLYDFGARKFVTVGVQPVGCDPGVRAQNNTENCSEEVNFWSSKYNEGLKSVMKSFKSEFVDIDYSYADIYTLFLQFIHHPPTYGFKEVKSACCGLGRLNADAPCIPNSTYCPDRDDHVFWDHFHFTQKTASIIIDNIFYSSQYTMPVNVNHLSTL